LAYQTNICNQLIRIQQIHKLKEAMILLIEITAARMVDGLS